MKSFSLIDGVIKGNWLGWANVWFLEKTNYCCLKQHQTYYVDHSYMS
jgi:hypothetical protein